MKRLLVLGAGTAGTMVVNKLRHRLDKAEWQITAVDQSDRHFYQPGYLFIPFGGYSPDEVVKPRRRFMADGVGLVYGEVDRVELVYATPLPGAFTKPIASRHLGTMLDERKIALETDFLVERIEDTTLISYDEREIGFDLLVTVPLNMGADYVGRSGLGNELNHVPVDKHTLLSKAYPNIFALGDASDIPASKAGSVAHFSVEIFTDNFVRYARGEPMTDSFDGHANCFVESGNGKGLLIDFNYDTEPLPGKYPVPGIGPFSLLKETTVNHWGKLAFRWMYWNLLLPGRPVPLPAHMSMAGKHTEE